MNRKTFVQTSVRIVIFSVFATIVVFLAKRNKISMEGPCEVKPGCENCNTYSTCGKVSALNERKNEKK